MSREMNAEVALKFMGWRLRRPQDLVEEGLPVPESLLESTDPVIVAERDESIDFFTRAELPNFSGDIAAAWEVAEKMGSKLISISKNLAGSWVIMVTTPLGPKQFSAEKAPEAICRAALALAAKG